MNDGTAHTVTIGADSGDPRTVSATVVSVERREEPSIFGGSNVGLYAQLDVTVADGLRPFRFLLSRLIGEREWAVDALFTANGFPVHSNGFGARYLRVRVVAAELAVVLDREARDRGVVDQIGPDMPLALASRRATDNPGDDMEGGARDDGGPGDLGCSGPGDRPGVAQ